MQRIIVNGNALAMKLAAQIKAKIHLEEVKLSQSYTLQHLLIKQPQLDIINVGTNSASLSYLKNKINLAKNNGIRYKLHQFDLEQQESQEEHQALHLLQKKVGTDSIEVRNLSKMNVIKQVDEVITLIQELNANAKTSGILVQLPLPIEMKVYTHKIIESINELKDVDCLTLKNRIKILQHKDLPQLLPCTPNGVLRILDQYKIDVSGMKAVVIGRSSLVGLPLFHLLINRNATVTLCHAKTKNIHEETRQADLVFSAVGQPFLVKELKLNSIAIDIGISKNDKGKIMGDICQEAKKNCSLSTPVPGGVGPLTVVMLIQNTFKLWKRQNQILLQRHLSANQSKS